ncbi:MAG: hypothetical protein ACKV2O_18075 [Acidimicrobiales bacterium]
MGDLLGPNFLQLLLLALAGALVVGNALALVRPPAGRGRADAQRGADAVDHDAVDADSGARDGADSGNGGTDLDRAPVWRTVMMLTVGLIVVIWIVVSLIS